MPGGGRRGVCRAVGSVLRRLTLGPRRAAWALVLPPRGTVVNDKVARGLTDWRGGGEARRLLDALAVGQEAEKDTPHLSPNSCQCLMGL